MEIEYFGGNTVKISTKKAVLVTDDDKLDKIGGKISGSKPDIALYTSRDHGNPSAETIFDSPGEYEVKDISIQGISAKGFASKENTKTNTIFRILIDETRIAVAGSIDSDLDDDQLEAIGTVDILIVPVGGVGKNTDGIGALKLIKKIEPKIVIPTYFADKGLKYDPSPSDLTSALRDMSMEITEKLDKLKIKNRDIAENTQLIVLNRQ